MATCRHKSTRGTGALGLGRGADLPNADITVTQLSPVFLLPQPSCKIAPSPIESKMRTDGMGCKKDGLRGAGKDLISYQLGNFFLCIIMLLSVSKNFWLYPSDLVISIYSYRHQILSWFLYFCPWAFIPIPSC